MFKFKIIGKLTRKKVFLTYSTPQFFQFRATYYRAIKHLKRKEMRLVVELLLILYQTIPIQCGKCFNFSDCRALRTSL